MASLYLWRRNLRFMIIKIRLPSRRIHEHTAPSDKETHD
jgi:hypothetical protein